MSRLAARMFSFTILVVGFTLFCGTTLAQPAIESRTIEYSDGSTLLSGYLAYPKDLTHPAPGVVVVHEWWGHNEYAQKRARDFASLGYVAFALDMYGKGKGSDNVEGASALSKPFYDDRSLMRRRAQLGVAELKKFKFTDHTRLAMLGYCFGGTVSLEAARSGLPLAAAISFHGGLSTPLPASAENLHASILVLNGAEDPMVKLEERQQFMDEMRAAKADWQFVEFGNAVHAFSNPIADAKGIPGVAYNAAADQRSFSIAKEFLVERLGNK